MFSRQIAPVSRSRCAHGCGTTANVQHTLEQRAHELQAQLDAAEAQARARPTRSAAEIAKEAEMARELHELRRQNGALGAEAEASKDTLRGLSSQIRKLRSQIAKSDAQTSADEYPAARARITVPITVIQYLVLVPRRSAPRLSRDRDHLDIPPASCRRPTRAPSAATRAGVREWTTVIATMAARAESTQCAHGAPTA